MLSGHFTDAIFGGGASLTLSASDTAPEIIDFTSDFPAITALFNTPEGISLSFVDVRPVAAMVGTGCAVTPAVPPCTLASFTASVSGNMSGTALVVPEPGSVALLGTALLGLGAVGLRRRRRPGGRDADAEVH